MKYKELEPVVLTRDVPEHGLKAGDVGTLVNVGSPVHLDVEFMTATGRTKAVVTLTEEAIRPARDEEMIAVRPSPTPGP